MKSFLTTKNAARQSRNQRNLGPMETRLLNAKARRRRGAPDSESGFLLCVFATWRLCVEKSFSSVKSALLRHGFRLRRGCGGQDGGQAIRNIARLLPDAPLAHDCAFLPHPHYLSIGSNFCQAPVANPNPRLPAHPCGREPRMHTDRHGNAGTFGFGAPILNRLSASLRAQSRLQVEWHVVKPFDF